MKTTKRLASLALASALALTLSPTLAFADSLASADADSLTTQTAPIATQAKTKIKTMRLITRIETYSDYLDSTNYVNLNYNKLGLVKKARQHIVNEVGKQDNSTTFTYNKMNLTRVKTVKDYTTFDTNDTFRSTISYTIASKGGLPLKYTAKHKWSDEGDRGGSSTETGTYAYNKNKRLTSTKVKNEGVTVKTTYKTLKGLPVSIRANNTTTRYAYDAKGNMVSNTNRATDGSTSNTYKTKRKLTYKNGLVTNIKSDYGFTIYYTYKTIKVPTKRVALVKRQQWALLNRNLNGAFIDGVFSNITVGY